MAAVPVPKPNFSLPFVEEDGRIARAWRAWVAGMHDRSGGPTDKIEAAHALATAAVPQTTQAVAVAGVQGGGTLSGNVGFALYRAIDLTANLPATGNGVGDHAFATDGRKPGEGGGAGTGVAVIWTAGNWYSVFSGAVVTV